MLRTMAFRRTGCGVWSDRRLVRNLRVALAALLCFLAPLLNAQRWHATVMSRPNLLSAPPLAEMAHMSWTRRDGAPSDISALAQTADGYLWIGSRLGLFRFDGLQFLHYPFKSSDPQLPSSDIATLAADRDGGLWVGYRLGGISYLHGTRKIDYGKESGLVAESTEQLIARDDGSVWATADGRLMHLEGSKWENFAAKHGLDSDGLYSIFFDRDGTLWTAYKKHIVALKRGETTFRNISVPNGEANQFVQMPDGAIWFSDAFASVRPLDPAHGKQAVRIPGVPTLLVDNGSLWLAHDSDGLSRIQFARDGTPKKEDFKTASGLTDSQTRAILKDRQGSIWVGTARGLDRFQPSPLIPFSAVALDYYPALVADRRSGIWLNDMDKPLMLLRSGKLSFAGQAHGSSSLFQDRAGGVWLFDQITRDFFRYTEGGTAPSRVPAPPEVRQVENWCLGQDAAGALLACFEGHGLWRFDGTWAKVSNPQLPREAPFSMVQGDAGHLWLGYSYNRIVLQDASGYHTYGPGDGVNLNTALTFYEADGLMLAGGSDGLILRDGSGFHALHLRSAGLLRGISGIVKDRWGDLWLNAAPGVIRLPAAEWHAALRDHNYAMDFQLLQERDGLIGTPAQSKPGPSAIVDRDGLLWFATSGHLVAISPAAVRQRRAAPTVLLQSVLVNGSEVDSLGTTIARNSRDLKTLQLNYIGLDLQSPDQVIYQYMLEGEDKEWQDAGTRREVFYTNLAPGSYLFRVRAASGTGAWSELPQALPFVVRPAYYQAAWFRLSCPLLAALLLWWTYRLTVLYVTEQVRGRFEERAHERVRIARDLHDTLLQGVQGLILRFHFATEQLPPDEPARDVLRAALDQADQIVQEGRDKIANLRGANSQTAYLTSSLRQIAETYTATGTISINVQAKGEPKALNALAEDELYFIGREALTNAVRHADATQITLELTFHPRHLKLSCRDDGRGLDEGALQTEAKADHWGITGMRERAQRLGCTLSITSSPGSGTEIQVLVPGDRAYRKEARELLLPAAGKDVGPDERHVQKPSSRSFVS